MALCDCTFFSESLELTMSATVILPQATSWQAWPAGSKGGAGHPVLYLLHGLSDDHSGWLRQTAISRYVDTMGLAVVMPNVHRSFYADMVQGGKYFSFVADELPRIMRSFFPLSEKREDNFVAGLSMGGYGAFKCALARPDRFAAGASLSGALDRTLGTDTNGDSKFKMQSIRLAFGTMDEMRGSDNDLLHLASQVVQGEQEQPALYQCCGTADFLYDQNKSFLKHAREIGLEVLYEEHDGAEHTWDYWDRQIRRVLEWLPLPAKPGP